MVDWKPSALLRCELSTINAKAEQHKSHTHTKNKFTISNMYTKQIN